MKQWLPRYLVDQSRARSDHGSFSTADLDADVHSANNLCAFRV